MFSVFAFRHDLQYPTSRVPDRDRIEVMGQARFCVALTEELVHMIAGAGPRSYGVKVEMQGRLICIVINEHQNILHLLARVFWVPLEILRGHAPWRMTLDKVVNFPVMMDVAIQHELENRDIKT